MERKWIIPDIHGCVKTLKYMIEENIQLSKDDSLYFLGDYIDRGPDSKGVLDYIMNLQQNGYVVHYLMGNHEKYCIDAWEQDQHRWFCRSIAEKEWEKHGGFKTLKSFGVKRPRNIDERYINWMKNAEYYIELDNYILVHAGMNFNIINPFDDIMSMIWIRDFKVEKSKIGEKALIHGHVPVDISLISIFLESESYGFIVLDNGVYFNKSGFGNLTALELNTKKLLVQPNIDFS